MFTGNEGTFISLADGAALTAAYRTANPNGIKGHFLGIANINRLLGQTGCVGLRTYQGIDANGVEQIVVVAVDRNENDILAASPLILDKAFMCPPNCSAANALNS